MAVLTEEMHYRLLKLLEHNKHLTQRELAKALGISLGKTNYCLNAFIELGWVKMRRFRRSPNKLGYAYLLTPRGLDEKARVTLRFLRCKQAEYESLVIELEELRREVALIEVINERG